MSSASFDIPRSIPENNNNPQRPAMKPIKPQLQLRFLFSPAAAGAGSKTSGIARMNW